MNNSETLEKIIKTATLVVTCAYQVYQLWSTETRKLAKGTNE